MLNRRAFATCGRCSTCRRLSFATKGEPEKRGTTTSYALLDARNRWYAVSVRRAPAAIAMTAPPNRPSISVMASHGRHRVRSSQRARRRTAVISLRPQRGGRTDPPRDPPGHDGDDVRQQHGGRDHDERWNGRDDGFGNDTELVRVRRPRPPAGGDAERHAEQQRDRSERRGLPRDGGRDLTTGEPEGLQDRE